MNHKYICKKCKHEWDGRKETIPVTCPRCKSYNWDLDKKEIQEDDKQNN